MNPRWHTLILATLLIGSVDLLAQETLPAAPSNGTSRTGWDLNASLLGFFYTDTMALWNPAATADHGKLHLEARYQWEDWRTGSVWVGRNFDFGNELAVTFTPMAGAVFGLINGVAPGYVMEAEWRSLYLYSSMEYFIDPSDAESNFAYTWNELSVDLNVVSVGLVAQRLRPFDSELDLQRGFLVMREQGDLLFGFYVFNLGWTEPTAVLNIAYTFGTKNASARKGASPTSSSTTP